MTDEQPPQEPAQQPGPQQSGPQQPGPQQPGGWQPGGWQPGQPPGYAPAPPAHPQATTVLVLGILAIVVCQVIGPFAWIQGNRVLAEIDAANGWVGGRSEASIGRILGIVGTALLVAGAVFIFLFVVLNVALFAGVAGFASQQ